MFQLLSGSVNFLHETIKGEIEEIRDELGLQVCAKALFAQCRTRKWWECQMSTGTSNETTTGMM